MAKTDDEVIAVTDAPEKSGTADAIPQGSESAEDMDASGSSITRSADAEPADSLPASAERADVESVPAEPVAASGAKSTGSRGNRTKSATTTSTASKNSAPRSAATKSTTAKPRPKRAASAKTASAKTAAARPTEAKPPAAKPVAAKPTEAKTTAAQTAAAVTPTPVIAGAERGANKAASAKSSTTKNLPPTASIEADTSTAVVLARPLETKAVELVPRAEAILEVDSLVKRFGSVVAVDGVSFSLAPGSFTGIVGPNGAGKTTTLSMVTGMLRPTSGIVRVAGADVWVDPGRAKRQMGVLPDRLHLFDRLTGAQLLYYTAVLHGLDRRTALSRANDLATSFRIEHAMARLVTDYSSGMVKKIALAAALIHAPKLLVLDEPFESVDPVSAMTVTQILRDFAAAGGTVLLTSHSLDLVQQICSQVIVVVEGRVLADGSVAEVSGDRSLQERFLDLAGAGTESIAELAWLRPSSD